MSLKHFKVDPARHQLVVDVEFYQMGLNIMMENVKVTEPDAFNDDGIFLPGWTKFVANPVRAKGFFIDMLQSIFEGKGDDSLNIDFQTNRSSSEGTKVAMMFLPGSTKNAMFTEISNIAQQALKGFKIVSVFGDEMTNATAEQKVKEQIEIAEQSGQHVLILSAGMAQRSFSIPHITELYLAYDAGDAGATTQKMSRALTPDRVGKIGRIISLSFDPNRDDKFDAMMLETAQNYKKNHNISDAKEALRFVTKTINIFKCQPNGAVKLDVDTYLIDLINRKSIDRLIGRVAPINTLSIDMIHALASGNISIWRLAKQVAAEHGRASSINAKKHLTKKSTNNNKKAIEKAREMIVTISQNLDVIKQYSGISLEESFRLMDLHGAEIQADVTSEYGVDYELIKELVLTGVINRDLSELKFS